MDDEELIALLAASFDEIGPTPPAALDVARAAITMRDLDDRLADLVFDSWREDQQVAMRSTTTEQRLLSFSRGELTLDLTLDLTVDSVPQRVHSGDAATIVGQVSPDGVHPVTIERAGGETMTLDTDDHGRFRASIAAGPIRLRVADALVTPWISR